MRTGILPHILFFSLVLLSRDGLTDLKEKKGEIVGASHVNLRSGPGISHPPTKILRIGEEVAVERLEGSWYRVSLPDGMRGYVYEAFIYLLSRPEIKFAKEDPATAQVKQAAEESATEQPTEAAREESASDQETEVARKNSVAERVREGAEEQPFAQEKEAPNERNLIETNSGKNEEPSTPSAHSLDISTANLAERENPAANAIPPTDPSWGSLREMAIWSMVALCIFILGWILGGNYYLRRDRIERTKIHF